MSTRNLIILYLGAILAAGVEGSLAPRAAFAAGRPQGGVREAAGFGANAEQQLPVDEPVRTWLLDPAVFAADQGDLVEKRQEVEPDVKTVKLTDLVPPIPFREGEAEIPADYLDRLRDVLDSMHQRQNVQLHFVGHTDSLPLKPDLQALYGDNVGLSRERAGTTAEYFQKALKLPPEAISYEGLGDSQPLADNATEEGRARNRRVEVEVWYDEIAEKTVEKEVTVPREVSRIKVCRTETVCKLRYLAGHSHRTKVKNLVPPLHYMKGQVRVSEEFLQQIGQSLENLRGKRNVVVKFIAYTDNAPLTGRDKGIYGDQLGLSKAIARRVSLAVQDGLGLPDGAVASEGRGNSRPLAANDNPKGRRLNRRVEVEFWHDDPLQELPDEPQICPKDAGAETVVRIYNSPSGPVDPILFEDGNPVISVGMVDQLARIMEEIADKTNVRLRFVGYASDERLDRRTAAIYGDDIGWSTARARRAMEAINEQMGLPPQQVEFEGHGYVQSEDVVNAGFLESDASRVEVQVVYDELLALDTYEGVEISRILREVQPANPYALNLMRITVDGEPVDDPGKSIPDVQRCTDVALDRAQVQFSYDNLRLQPRLNVTAWPRTISDQDDPASEFQENRIRFRLYTNYPNFIQRAEVRIFAAEQSERDQPLAVAALDDAGFGQWQPDIPPVSAAGRELKYLVRVYDAEGRFDETTTQPLWVVNRIDPAVAQADETAELLAGYGESRLASRNIPLHGGTILVHGSAVPEGRSVWLAGYPVPVDREGKFVSEIILPQGMHTVELALLDQEGNGELFLRDLKLDKNDWFTVGIADLTLGANWTNGAASELKPEDNRYSDKYDAAGRLAFYSKGKFDSGWGLTASADTREGPLDEIFSNFMDKSPEALFRRFDPEDRQPTYGDDSTVVEDAPTLGKFYLKLEKDNDYGLWGNFKLSYTDNDLTHVDRGLYGANLHHQSGATTSFGEPRLLLDGFAADPGTVAGRDEFRGTGGSLYYLRRRDILQGSERLRIEIRDKDSGLVLKVKNLTPGLDYDIDYLQGRVLLSEPLSPNANGDLLVQTEANGGLPAYLVARYEFTPGFDDPDVLTVGGNAQTWLNDYVKFGVTASRNDEAGDETRLAGANLTLRKSAGSWLKLETGRSTGTGMAETGSIDGGFDFTDNELQDNGESNARARRADASVAFSDLFDGAGGRSTLYYQQLDAGYSAPGLLTSKETVQYGGMAEWPATEKIKLRLKADKMDQQEGLETEAGELDADYQVGEHWTLGAGLRRDQRSDNSADAALTQEEGQRTDALVKMTYDSRERWTTYGFGQKTLTTSDDREDNNRYGAGGSYRVTDRFKLNGEASGGDLGGAGRLGAEYLYSDRTTLYLNYTQENDRTDNGLRARKGTMVSGVRTRYSDSASVYMEERYVHGDAPTGLLHSTGVDLTPSDRLNLGADLDYGTFKDRQTGAETKRTAAGIRAGYGFDKLKLANAVEYRVDEQEQPDAGFDKRTTWLTKNSFKHQLNPSWRLIGQFNYSRSTSSQGEFYDGRFTEAVFGSAYRPVVNDRLNALLKYTYFANVPAVDQTAGQTTGQTTGGNATSTFLQRSHIAALDVDYDLTSYLSVGGKYAYRLGEVSQDRVDPNYFSSKAHLFVLRTDWRILQRWDALVEGRVLDLPDAGDRLSGMLLGVYRRLGNHVKLGVGYNFSKFTDDLTDLDYDHRGLFINLVGKF